MRQKIGHLLKGAVLVGAAATVGAVVGDVQILGLSAQNAALLTGALTVLQSWLADEAEKENPDG